MNNDRLSSAVAILFLITIALIIVMGFEYSPTTWRVLALGFAASAMSWFWLDLFTSATAWKLVRNIGGTMNILAITVNQGRMPVLGKAETERWWQPLTDESRLQFLCDIHWGASLGDFVILSAVLVWVVSKFYQWTQRPLPEQGIPS